MASGDLFNRKKLLARATTRAGPSDRKGADETARPAEGREVFERPTVLPATTAEEHAARAMRRLETTEEPAPPRRQPSQRPTRPSPHGQGRSTQLSSGHTAAPVTQRSAQLPSRQVLGVFRSPTQPQPSAAPAPRLESVELQSGPLESTSDPSQSNPHSSLTLPSVESRGSVAGALRFVDAQSRRSLPPPTLEAARDARSSGAPELEWRASLSELYALDDFSGALEVAEQRLAENPGDAYAQRIASDCRNVLSQMYLARIGRWTQRPRLAVDDEQLRWLSLDHHGGFLLSQIDGTLTIEELLDICGMPRVEALRILAELTEKGVVAIE